MPIWRGFQMMGRPAASVKTKGKSTASITSCNFSCARRSGVSEKSTGPASSAMSWVVSSACSSS